MPIAGVGAAADVDPVASLVTALNAATTATTAAGTAATTATSEVRARTISPTQDTYGASTSGTAAANTTAINAALTAAATSGAGVVLPGGTYSHNGITYPAAGRVDFAGAGRGKTILSNTHASNASVTVTGVGGGGATPYAERYTLSNLTLTAPAKVSGQYGVVVTLTTRFDVSDVFVQNHEDGFRFVSAWRGLFSHIEASSCTNGFHFLSGYAGSTPLTFVDCHAASNSGKGVYIENSVDGLTWVGGDFGGNVDGFVVLGNAARNMNVMGLNFEDCTGTDIIIGDGTTTPNSINFYGCRHLRPGTTGTRAIDFVNGGPLSISGAYFGNYTTAIRQGNVTGTLTVVNPFTTSVTTFLDANGTTVAASGYIVSSPTSYGQISPSNLITRGAVKTGNTSAAGAALYSGSGAPSSGLGSNGDFYLRTDGGSGTCIYQKRAGSWATTSA